MADTKIPELLKISRLLPKPVSSGFDGIHLALFLMLIWRISGMAMAEGSLCDGLYKGICECKLKCGRRCGRKGGPSSPETHITPATHVWRDSRTDLDSVPKMCICKGSKCQGE